MSEIKVNKISPRTACGTTTLGDSGDTFTIPAGVSITNSGTASGFGATGSASWNTTVKTGDFTAVVGEGYFVNTTSGEIDVALPAGSAGAVVAVKDYAKTWNTNNCILVPNGSDKIGGIANSATLSTLGLAITLVYIDSTQGWLVTDDGLQSNADNNPFLDATGGTITTSGNCKIHTFTGPGTFTVSGIANCAANNQVSYTVVAGGGGGGNGYQSGGGGAGGFREDKSPITPYTASPLEGAGSITVTATGFPITVGAGGATGPGTPVDGSKGLSGSNSVFSTITSAGGGGGGSFNTPLAPGLSGGSGGGAGRVNASASGGSGNTPPVSPSQGFPGGDSGTPYTYPYSGAGGGGATVKGACVQNNQVSAGGNGATTSITASPVVYAGGGGGGGYASPTPSSGPSDSGDGGTGGGGKGAYGNTNAGAGTTNLGGGGGGSAHPGTTGGAGGSGVVIIRYKFQ